MHIQSVHGIHLVHFLLDEENSDEDDDDDDDEEESEESAKMEVDIKQKQKKTEETPKTAVRKCSDNGCLSFNNENIENFSLL